jgi:hypothetical protein
MPFFIADPPTGSPAPPLRLWAHRFATREEAAAAAPAWQEDAPYVLIEAPDLRAAVEALRQQPQTEQVPAGEPQGAPCDQGPSDPWAWWWHYGAVDNPTYQ